MTATKRKWPQKSIYVPEYLADIWDAVNVEGESTGRGVGYILLAAYAKTKKITMPEYRGKNG